MRTFLTKVYKEVLFVLLLVVVLGSPKWIAFYKEHKLRKDTYQFVRDCTGLTGGLTFWEIKIRITEGDRIMVHDGSDYFIAAAMFNPEDSTIYIPEAHRYQPQILGHEYLHAFGVFGHTSPLFKKCLLDTSQMYTLDN